MSETRAGLFQSRYRAASHFRFACQKLPAPAHSKFQSRYRAASHFRDVIAFGVTFSLGMFQSRYRAASHFRADSIVGAAAAWAEGFNLVIERLLISGLTVLEIDEFQLQFQSRYRAASHFRSINLFQGGDVYFGFQSRYRAASHFRSGMG